MAQFGGWTGKILRVDLTTKKVTSVPTLPKYQDYMGGSGLGYKVMWDEVPVGTSPFAPANRIVFGGGPLTGTSAMCSARCTITSLWPNHPDDLVSHGHMGGHWAPELKWAGWDAVIVQGKADKPVWICIEDDEVTIRDASHLWGGGIFRATAAITAEMGPEAHVAAIGQAGENMINQAVIMCDRSHSAGGLGGVMGSKNLKAIGVRGTGSLQIAADAAAWKKLNHYALTLIGANNQGVVPRTPQPWAEYSYLLSNSG